MEKDPFTALSEQQGCALCGQKGVVFYTLHYYILPTRLVRKRHRDKERLALCCRDCFEADDVLRIEVGGVGVAVSKECKKTRFKPKECTCMVCGELRDLGGLYGVVTTTLFMDGSMIESAPLARLCSDCAEQKEVHLLRERGAT